MNYKEYVAQEKKRQKEKQYGCAHEFRDEVIYMKCKHCGAFMPFRSKEDFEYRGEMPLIDDSDLGEKAIN